MSNANPDHYATTSGEDVYDALIGMYGYVAWRQHVEMEIIQYVYRHSNKGTPAADLNKVRVILDRLDHERIKRYASSKIELAMGDTECGAKSSTPS